MDPRTEHLVALVKEGATLKDAARVYGISGERVRQMLEQAGLTAAELPAHKREAIEAALAASDDGERPETALDEGQAPNDKPWSTANAPNRTQLWPELERFGAALRSAKLRDSTIHQYLTGSTLFVRWLEGDYVPRGRR